MGIRDERAEVFSFLFGAGLSRASHIPSANCKDFP